MDTFSRKFSSLSFDFGPVPWWAWTGKMEKKEMLKQLEGMKSQRISEFFIFPIYGLEYPHFLQESWWEYIEFTLKTCRKLGMKIWIYDELNWPSGTAGGYLLKEHPEYRSWHITLKKVKVNKNAFYHVDFPQEIIQAEFRAQDEKRITVNLKQKKSWRNRTSSERELWIYTKEPIENLFLNCQGTLSSWQQHGYGDMLSKEAVRCWTSYIHEEYRRRFKDYFVSTLVGFFFDEPSVNIKADSTLPWTRGLFTVFKKRYGYDLRERLYQLYLDQGNYQVVRVHFWSLIAEFLGKNFSKQVSDWCRRYHLLSTGHCIYEEDIIKQTATNGDIHEVLKWIQVPGMDMLKGWFGKGDNNLRNLILTAKRVSSTARYSRAERTMCEAFGVRDWNCTLADQKVDNDWLAAMGINLINDNSLIYTISGFRKRAISGKHFTQPWWKYYQTFSDYCRRACLFASSGQTDTEIAVLYSKTSAWSTVEVGSEDAQSDSEQMLEILRVTLETLTKNHLDFELLFEDILQEAEVKQGTLRCPNADFRVVIIPAAYGLESRCAKILQEFADSGGTIIFAGFKPKWIVSKSRNLQKQPYRFKNASVIAYSKQKEKLFSSKLIKEILNQVTLKWGLKGRKHQEIVSAARECPNRYLIFLANQTQGIKGIRLSHRLSGVNEIFDLDTGKIYQAPVRNSGKKKTLDLNLSEEQSIIVSISKVPAPRAKPLKEMATWMSRFKKIIPLDNQWSFSVNPENHYLPDLFFKLDPLGKGLREKWYAKPIDHTWQAILEEEIPLSFTQEESAYYWVRGEFNLTFVTPDLKLIVDNQNWDCPIVNGKKAEGSTKIALWDQNNRSFPLAEFCRKGKNHFAIRVRSSIWRSNRYPVFPKLGYFVDPVVIAGDFRVRDKGKESILEPETGKIESGSWTKQGYPHFAGTGIYKQKLNLKEVSKISRLVVEDAFSVVEAKVNGKPLGVRAWKPYAFDASGVLKQGENEMIISVTNTLGNILRRSFAGKTGKPTEGGILGRVYIDVI